MREFLDWLKIKLVGEGACYCRAHKEAYPIKFTYKEIKYALPIEATNSNFVRLPDGVTLCGEWSDEDFTPVREIGYESKRFLLRKIVRFVPEFVFSYTNAVQA